jgi:hypothetical protein
MGDSMGLLNFKDSIVAGRPFVARLEKKSRRLDESLA